jgi:hypothetical protein
LPVALRARWQSGIQRIRLDVFLYALSMNGTLFFWELRTEAFPAWQQNMSISLD